MPPAFALTYGIAKPEDVSGMTGREMLQAMIDGKLPAPPIAQTLGFWLVEVGDGQCAFEGDTGSHLLNPLGGVHGGWAATLLDSALACAVQTLLERGEAYTTAALKVNLTRPITPRTGEVVCEGKVVHKGRTLAVSEATLRDAGGKLLAFGTETCSIFPAANLAAR